MEISPRTVSGVNEAASLRFHARGVSVLTDAVTRALVRAAEARQTVRVVTRGDLAAGWSARLIEGVPTRFSTARDGREQVRIATSLDAEQTLLLERIATVLPSSSPAPDA